MGPAGLFAEDADDYARKLELLLADAALRERLGAKGTRHAERYYSLTSCVHRLEGIYDGVLGRHTVAPAGPIAYGQSKLGFLVAGEVDDPGSMAHHVVGGSIPDEAALDLLRALLADRMMSYLELGTPNTLLVALAASHGASPCELCAEGVARDIEATVSLNNWEDRVTITRDRDGLHPRLSWSSMPPKRCPPRRAAPDCGADRPCTYGGAAGEPGSRGLRLPDGWRGLVGGCHAGAPPGARLRLRRPAAGASAAPRGGAARGLHRRRPTHPRGWRTGAPARPECAHRPLESKRICRM